MKPAFLAIGEQFLLNACTALAVTDFLKSERCADVSVKWPNDVYVGKKKICGILVESQLRGNQLVWSVIGIGLNINQNEFPISTATSLSIETGKAYELDDCLSKLVSYVEARYLQTRQSQKEKLVREYESRLYWKNERRQFRCPERGLFDGVISGIDSSGRLRLSLGSEEVSFGTKEIVFVA